MKPSNAVDRFVMLFMDPGMRGSKPCYTCRLCGTIVETGDTVSHARHVHGVRLEGTDETSIRADKQ